MATAAQPVDLQVARVAERLVHDFNGRVEDGTVRRLVTEAYSGYATARVTQFVPVLVDRVVRQQLRDG